MEFEMSPRQLIMLFGYSFILFTIGVCFGQGLSPAIRALISGVGGFGMGISFLTGMIMLKGQQEEDDDNDDDFHNRINRK